MNKQRVFYSRKLGEKINKSIYGTFDLTDTSFKEMDTTLKIVLNT